MNKTLTDIYLRDEGICHLCGLPVAEEDASIDHLVPRSAGGSSNYINLFLAHKFCNSSRGDYTKLSQSNKANIITRYGNGTLCLACSHSRDSHYGLLGCRGIRIRKKSLNGPFTCGCVGHKALDMAMFKPDGLKEPLTPQVIVTVAASLPLEGTIPIFRCVRKQCKHSRESHDQLFDFSCLICSCPSFIWDMKNV